VLSGFFYLSSLLVYLRFGAPAGDARPGKFSLYILSFFLFICALLSKTVTATLPVAIGLILWWKRPKLVIKDIIPLLPMLMAGAGMGLVTVWMEKYHVKAAGDGWSLSFIERLLVAGRALWFYLAKLVWPHRLTFIYPRWNIDPANPAHYIYPAAFLVLLAFLYFLRRKIGRGPLAGAGFFVVSLIPALGFFDVYPFRYSYVADHFQYLASLGIIAVITGTGCSWLLRRQQYRKTAGLPAAVLLLAALGTLTFRQSGIYRDIKTLWQDTLAKNPACWMAYNNLGIYYLQQGNQDQAEGCFQKAVFVDPGKADHRSNLGLLHLSQGLLPEALADFKIAVRLEAEDSRTHYNLGQAYLQMDSLPQAEAELKKAILLNIDYAKAHCNLGIVYFKQKKYSRAELELKIARALNPGLYQAGYCLALTCWNRGKTAEAEAEFLRTLQVQPDFPVAEYDLGRLYLELGRRREAEARFRSLRQKHPEFIEAK
jgi:tetratricopeptide (TPR) repeat protein